MVGLGTKGMLPRASGMGRVRPNRPVITSSDTVTVNTGDQTVETVTAVSAGQVQYYIVGGADRGLFTINQGSGELSFLAPSVDGTYEVEVRAEGPGGSADQTITVTVQAAVYHADAVHFDGSTYLTLASIVQAASGPGYAFSVWVKLADLAFNPNLFAVLIPADHTTSFASVVMRTPTASGVSEIGQGCWDATFTDFLAGNSPTGAWTAATWVNVAVSVKTNLSAGNKLQKVVASGTNQTPIGGVSDTDPSFAIDYSAQTLAIPDDPLDASLFTGDMADFQLWLGQYIDWSDAGNLSKVISGGKPVNPTIAAAAFGAQTVLLSGDAAAFATNQGTGGAFTLTGSLTDASTSPSD